MSTPKPKRNRELHEIAMDFAAKTFATFLGIDNVPIVWNQNPYRTLTKEGLKRSSYPIIYIKFRSMKRSEWAPKTKHTSQPAYGKLVDEGNSRTSLRLTPVTIDLEFMIITDDPNDAMTFVTKLLVGDEDFTKRKELSFAMRNKALGDNFSVTNQLVLTSEQYDIQDVEFDESTPMEYNIVGTMQLNTRATFGGIDPTFIPTFAVYSNINPTTAVMNDANTTSGLTVNATSEEPIPVAIRDSQGLNQ